MLPTNTEFCKVTRKKWIARKSYNKQRKNSNNNNDVADCPTEIELKKCLKNYNDIQRQMLKCDYFKDSVHILSQVLEEKSVQLERIICFGLGSFIRNQMSLHQLSYILNIKEHFSVQDTLFYDPIFLMEEIDMLKNKFNANVISENCEGNYKITDDITTLFYLPHCPYALTNNLLWSNWCPDNLKNILILGNSFDNLLTYKTTNYLQRNAAHIQDIQPYATEIMLRNNYKLDYIFNDISLHVFPLEKLPGKNASFWLSREAPVYADDDVELITVNQCSDSKK